MKDLPKWLKGKLWRGHTSAVRASESTPAQATAPAESDAAEVEPAAQSMEVGAARERDVLDDRARWASMLRGFADDESGEVGADHGARQQADAERERQQAETERAAREREAKHEVRRKALEQARAGEKKRVEKALLAGTLSASGWIADVDPKLALRWLLKSLHSDLMPDSENRAACAELLRCLNTVGERLKVDPKLHTGWARRDETWLGKTIRLARLVDGELVMSEPVPIGGPAEILAKAVCYFDDDSNR